MIRYQAFAEFRPQHSAGIFRFYPGPTDDPLADYTGVCTVLMGRGHAWLYAMHGEAKLPHLIDMARWFHANGVTHVWAERSRGRRLPLFKEQEYGHQLTLIADWINRFGAAAGVAMSDDPTSGTQGDPS